MKTRAYFALMALLAGFTASTAIAQWQWIDEHGRKTFSDRPPPPHIPEKNILKSPVVARTVTADTLPKAELPEDSQEETAEKTAADAPPKTPDPQAAQQLKQEAERKAAEEKQKREEQAKFIQQRMENCTRAQTALRTLQSDAQIGQIGPDGQQTAMSTLQREQETRRVRDVIARDCGPLPKETP